MATNNPRHPVTIEKEKKQHYEKRAAMFNMHLSTYLLAMVDLAEAAGLRPGLRIPEGGLVDRRRHTGKPRFQEYVCKCGQNQFYNVVLCDDLTCYICGSNELTFIRNLTDESAEEEVEVSPIEDDEEEGVSA